MMLEVPREFAEQLALARDGGDTRTVRVSIPTASSATMEFAATTDSEVAAASAAHDEFDAASPRIEVDQQWISGGVRERAIEETGT